MEDKKCAPGKDYKDGSCFTVNNLVKIAKAYNSNFDRLNTSNYFWIHITYN